MPNNLSAFVVLAAVMCFARPALADEIDGWCAEYTSDRPQYIQKLVIRKEQQKVKVHAYGLGFPRSIDWGESDAEVYHALRGPLPGLIAHLHYSPENTEIMLVIAPNAGGDPAKPGGVILVSTYVKSADGAPRNWGNSQLKSQGWGKNQTRRSANVTRTVLSTAAPKPSAAPSKSTSPSDGAQSEGYKYPVIKWKAHSIATMPGVIAQLTTTHDQSSSGDIKYKLTLYDAGHIPNAIIELLDVDGLKVGELYVGDSLWHAVPGANAIEAEGQEPLGEDTYKRIRDYVVK